MKTALISMLIVFISILSINAQDATSIKSTLNIETKGAGILVSTQGKRNNTPCMSCVVRTISDNPINHFAIYSGLTHKLTIDQKFEFETGIFIEERSFSGGSNTLANWVLYPKIFLSGKDTLNIFSNKVQYSLMGGDFWNKDFDDMLRFHNLDYQGLNGELIYKNYALGFLIIGDLATNVGLGLHQLHKYYVRRTFSKIELSLFISDNQLTNRHIQPRDINLGKSIKFEISEHFNARSQIELRLNKQLENSFAIGIGVDGNIKNLKFQGSLKYYQANFNSGYGTSEVLQEEEQFYRDGELYIGKQLYPLKNFFRTYSQWGNYTKQQGRDLLGFEFNILWEKKIAKRMHFFADIDLNIIGNPQNQTGETIPLYTVGISNKYFNLFRTEFYMTNKFMDIDTFYQTFQASKKIFFGGRVLLDIKDILLSSKNILPKS